MSDHLLFESEYLSLRQKEGRLYTDDMVAKLPELGPLHPLYREWKIRKRSGDRLFRYCLKKKQAWHILEVGCGNGWLSNRLAQLPSAEVTGIDINRTELQQARRVFQRQNLSFFYGDIRDETFAGPFDMIVFAASLQYFPSLPELLNKCFASLKDTGEIHILDTHFYTQRSRQQARDRSLQYFEQNGAAGCQSWYFHHDIEALKPFKYDILFNPSGWINKWRQTTPFPWIRIHNKKAQS